MWLWQHGRAARGRCGSQLHLTVRSWNSTYLGDEKNQEDRVSDLLLRFEPLASIVALVLETSRVPYGRTIWPSRIGVLGSWSRVVRGLIVTTVLPTHDGGGCKGLVVLRGREAEGYLQTTCYHMTSCGKAFHRTRAGS